MSNKDTEIDIKEHQQPQQAYQLTMVIENAPGLFGLIEGSAQYDVVNHQECGQLNALSGTRSRITTHPEIKWKALGNDRYSTIVYRDLIVDEDYYGSGVCRWTLTAASALLKATGAEIETRFLPGISTNDILAEKTVKLYFWKKGYPAEPDAAPDDKGFPDFGYESPDKFRPELRGDLFTVTLMAEEIRL